MRQGGVELGVKDWTVLSGKEGEWRPQKPWAGLHEAAPPGSDEQMGTSWSVKGWGLVRSKITNIGEGGSTRRESFEC